MEEHVNETLESGREFGVGNGRRGDSWWHEWCGAHGCWRWSPDIELRERIIKFTLKEGQTYANFHIIIKLTTAFTLRRRSSQSTSLSVRGKFK